MRDDVIRDDLGVLIAAVERTSSLEDLVSLRSFTLRKYARDPRAGVFEAALGRRLRELGVPQADAWGPP